MRIRPYVGITDFTNFEQVRSMLQVLREHRQLGSARQLHVGVMMSRRTLHDLETEWLTIFPQKETIADIFRERDDDVYYCLHYADYGVKTTRDDIRRAIEFAGPHVSAIQLDMTWPDPLVIADGIRASGKQVQVILQIGRKSFKQMDDDPEKVARKLNQYIGIIHRVLLDKSMGDGQSMSARELIPFAREINDESPYLGLVVAGGLGPHSMDLVKPLVEEFPDVSIDAQGKLRPSGDVHDPINWDMAGAYLVKALEMLK